MRQSLHKHGLLFKSSEYKINKISILQNAGDEVSSKVLDEMKNILYYKPLYHPPYSKEVTIYIVTAL